MDQVGSLLFTPAMEIEDIVGRDLYSDSYCAMYYYCTSSSQTPHWDGYECVCSGWSIWLIIIVVDLVLGILCFAIAVPCMKKKEANNTIKVMDCGMICGWFLMSLCFGLIGFFIMLCVVSSRINSNAHFQQASQHQQQYYAQQQQQGAMYQPQVVITQPGSMPPPNSQYYNATQSQPGIEMQQQPPYAQQAQYMQQPNGQYQQQYPVAQATVVQNGNQQQHESDAKSSITQI